MKKTAGTLLYRYRGEQLEVLMVHPSGNYNRKAPWSIPKGEPNEGEELEQAAVRETFEETGVICAFPLTALGHIDYSKSRKRVFCFTAAAPDDAAPRCASWEVDKAEFVDIEQARKLLHPDQVIFLDRMLAAIAEL